jgi:ribosome-binding protein aMBF1 (putative translation factor)
MTMLTHAELKRKALKRPEVKAAYDAQDAEFALLDALLKARVDAGLSQADVAARMGTKQTAISRLESSLASDKHSPSLSTLRKYAAACGKTLVLKMV